jgi:hypothetical protein
MVLLLNIRGEKRPGVTFNASKEMEDVQKCMDLLKACETRYVIVRRIDPVYIAEHVLMQVADCGSILVG